MTKYPNKKILFFLALFFGIFGVAESSQAANINSASCNQDDVQNAINLASDGDTVFVPFGSCVWTSRAGNSRCSNAPVCISNKSVILKGAGMDSVRISSTVGTNYDQNMIFVDEPDGKYFRISGFTFEGNARVLIYGKSKTWRIDNNKFYHTTGQLMVFSYSYGVIDHNIWDNPSEIVSVHIREQEATDNMSGNISWNRGVSFGTADAVFIEDNSFISDNVREGVIDAEAGSRYVYRHNWAKNSGTSMHDAIIADTRSALSWEIYDNDFLVTLSYTSSAISIRGGTGRVFNNRITATDANPFFTNAGDGIAATDYRVCDNSHQSPWNTWCNGTVYKACLGIKAGTHTCQSDADCNGEIGACQVLDGSGDGYPCRDQMGMGSDVDHVPTLFWNNTLNGTPISPYIYNAFSNISPTTRTECQTNAGLTASYIQLDRDYCTSDSVMPASCNGISSDYVPYTYPHPFVADCGQYPNLCDNNNLDILPPSAPSGLQVM